MLKKLSWFLFWIALAVLGFITLPQTNAASTNLLANPSVETTNSAGTLPLGWNQDKWGTNTETFTYKSGDANTGSRSLYINMTKRSSGDAKWYFTNIPVKPAQKYTYSEYYKSSVATEVDVEYTSTTNKLTYGSLLNSPINSTGWKSSTITFTTPANVKSLTIFHIIDKVGWVQTDDFSLAEGDGTTTTPPAVTPPTVSITAPTANATLSGTQNINSNASSTSGIAGVQFKLDGVNIGSEDTAAPYSVSWDTKSVANGTHTITATARNSSGLTATASETVNVQNTVAPPPTAPAVNFTAPANSATVSGKTQTVSANATDTSSVSGVQFKLDNNNLGTEDTTAPYSVIWDTTTIANGSHTLSATARNGAGLIATATETVIVSNAIAPLPAANNLIANPSFEASANNTAPDSWSSSNWGTNTSTFSYLGTGHTGNHSVKVQTTSYTNGAANWYYNDLPVTAGKSYKYENWYQSNVDTEVDAQVIMSDNTVQYYWLGTVLANTSWTKFSTTFTVPAGAKSLAIYQILAKTGYIVSDDYSLSEYTPAPFSRGIVSVTLDDGWANQYQNAYPLLQKYGVPATFYIISGELTSQPDYMSGTQVKTLQGSGHEIASHSVTHPDLTTLSLAQMQQEMSQSKTTLENLLGIPVTDFAYPFGAYNANTIATGKQYYQSQRTVNGGLNTKDTFDITTLKIYEVDSNISQAQVQGWIQAAIAQKSWLILVYHEIAITPTDPTDALYTTKPADLDAELSYLKTSGVATLTVNQAINEILPQL